MLANPMLCPDARPQDGGRLPLRAPSLAQNMANSRTGRNSLSVLDNFELGGRPGLGAKDKCPSALETRRLRSKPPPTKAKAP